MYTGGLENYPEIIAAISVDHPLWGATAAAVGVVRDPHLLAKLVHMADLPVVPVRAAHQPPPPDAEWLVKPLASAGGAGIRTWRGGALPLRSGRGVYFQKFIPGEPRAAVYFADGYHSVLLGVTRQLVGEPWLHAGPFAYCGSVGPIQVDERILEGLRRLGEVLTEAAGLRGLFGVDFILHDGRPWVVEVNPRYTASVEVLERVTACSTLRLCAAHFLQGVSCAEAENLVRRGLHIEDGGQQRYCGKAILFAADDLDFGHSGAGEHQVAVARMREKQEIADIPAIGTRIRKGGPILTVFAEAERCEAVIRLLSERSRILEQCLTQQ
jgi:predicted ATP-grasp superfamily ATP-dependent carboligase